MTQVETSRVPVAAPGERPEVRERAPGEPRRVAYLYLAPAFVFYLLMFAIVGYESGDWHILAVVFGSACLAKGVLDPTRRRIWMVLAYVAIGLALIGTFMEDR